MILSVGRLSDQKDYPTLLRAFALVHEQTPVRLMILGEGGNPKKTAKRQKALMRQASELGIAHEIELPGFISNPYPLMSRAGVFVLSSTYEGLPTVLIEAMACGCPVVSTDYPGAVEILDHGTWGRLARVGDPASLARAIQETLDASRNPEQLRLRARDFSGERAAAAYEQLITGDVDQAALDDSVRARTPHRLRAGTGVQHECRTPGDTVPVHARYPPVRRNARTALSCDAIQAAGLSHRGLPTCVESPVFWMHGTL